MAKTRIFQLKRTFDDLASRGSGRLRRTAIESEWHPVSESRSELLRNVSEAERRLEQGKVRNLKVAAGFLSGAVLGPEAVFSFWAQVPRPTGARGFVEGRELREGCIIPSVGGGLCQLSNALYDAALKAGFEIIERHAHSRAVPGSMAAVGRDATVFWNYVDLRFRAPFECQLEVAFEDNELVVRFRSREAVKAIRPTEAEESRSIGESLELAEAGSCETCGQTECFRHRS